MRLRSEGRSSHEWLRMFDINVMSGVRLSRHYFPRMLARMIEADEIAAMVALLASPPGAFMSHCTRTFSAIGMAVLFSFASCASAADQVPLERWRSYSGVSWDTPENGQPARFSGSVNAPIAGIHFDAKGNLYITDVTRNGIVRYEPKTRTMSLIAENESVRWPDTPAIRPDGDLIFTSSSLNDHFAGAVKPGHERYELWRLPLDASPGTKK